VSEPSADVGFHAGQGLPISPLRWSGAPCPVAAAVRTALSRVRTRRR